MTAPALHWFRRDLRLADNPALATAARRSAGAVHPVFVIDPTLTQSRRVGANRLAFLYARLRTLDAELRSIGSALIVLQGDPRIVLPAYVAAHGIGTVTWQADPAPWGAARDAVVAALLTETGVAVDTSDSQILVPVAAIRSGTGSPYTVFTPYAKRWRQLLAVPAAIDTPFLAPVVTAPDELALPAVTCDIPLPDTRESYARDLLQRFAVRRIAHYDSGRDQMAQAGTSMLSPYIRFGILSIQACARVALSADGPGAAVWLSELAWRDFYTHIAAHFPHIRAGNYRRQYDALQWENDPRLFDAWCRGQTGYPVVDAAMRQLTSTGWMHNRARMIVASFLTKDLLIDWRWGERFFMQHLLDGDTPANNGGWQWAASTGTDAQPYFRIFNPSSQGQRFDPDGAYVKRFVPELARVPAQYIHTPWLLTPMLQHAYGVRLGVDYPHPIVDHAAQRPKVMAMFAAARTDAAGESDGKNG